MRLVQLVRILVGLLPVLIVLGRSAVAAIAWSRRAVRSAFSRPGDPEDDDDLGGSIWHDTYSGD